MGKNNVVYGIAGLTAYVEPNNNGKIDRQSELDNFLEGIGDNEKLRLLLKAITDLIPSAASALNQLADKDYVHQCIATAAATYRGSYNLVSDLELTVTATAEQIVEALAAAIQTADNNDYCYVQVPTSNVTPTEIARVDKYTNNGTAWAYAYSINNSGFTTAQWAALNSGITSGLVAKLNALPNNESLTQTLAQKLENSDLADVIDTVAIADDTNGDITIQYEDDEPEPQENNNNEE